ncbi:MAG: NAD(+) synthase, partial [Bacteroidaceae bacterium]|nr:NAD(+) synthase [Bacteroidaceae bacterium]
MSQLNYIKVGAATLDVKVSNIGHHKAQIIQSMDKAQADGVRLLCLPELSLTGYTCQDLFWSKKLLQEARQALLEIAEYSLNRPGLVAVVGLPIEHCGRVFNCSAVVAGGKVCGLVAKTNIPAHSPMPEQRWFASADVLPELVTVTLGEQTVPLGNHLVFDNGDFRFGIEFTQDMLSLLPPSSLMVANGADIILHPAACPALVDSETEVLQSMLHHSRTGHSAHVLAASGWGESTTDFVFTSSTIVVENGKELLTDSTVEQRLLWSVADVDIANLHHLRRRQSVPASVASHAAYNCDVVTLPTMTPTSAENVNRVEDALPFVPQGEMLDKTSESVLQIQSAALARRIQFTHAKCVVLGISGGLDSTLALLVAARAMDMLGLSRQQIVAITMPGFGTTGRTYQNALQMMSLLGVDVREILIREACKVHLADINHSLDVHDVTYENAQARERTQILMDLANKMGGFVVGTGDLSELALGWATYGGDHISMYGVNGSVPKTLVKALVEYESRMCGDAKLAQTLMDVVETPISPELLPTEGEGNSSQVTEDLVGPYELHDFFLYHFLHYGASPRKIYDMALRAFDGHDSRVS